MNTSTSNPYAAPRAQVGDVYSEGSLQPVRLWNPGGRMGRLHYIGYSAGLPILLALVLGIAAALLLAVGLPQGVVGLLIGLGYIAYFIVFFEFTVQRCHDMNWSGWLCLLAMIPLVNFLFWFVPGTPGANRWGSPPEPGPRWVAVLMVVGIVLFIGILAAVALPAYQGYVERARAVQAR